MEFRVLGAVSALTDGGEQIPLGPAMRRSLLAMLLLRPNTAVGVDRLTEALWGEEPPRHSRTVLQGHVSRLRALLAEHGAPAYGVELVTQGRAYLLRLPESLVDAHRFEELLQLARGQRDPGDAVSMLREALSLWQGPALAGTVYSTLLETAAHMLQELRLAAVEELADAHGRLGEHGTAAAVLHTEAIANPLRESLIAVLMLALGRAGRRSEALDWFHRTRRLLADQLGIDPGAALTDAYTALLRADTPQAAAAPAPAPTSSALVPSSEPQETRRAQEAREPREISAPAVAPHHIAAVPQLLPRRPGGFTGRKDELAALDRATASGSGPIAVITGSAGVGKTSLAVHWAHHRRADFPDGRLFVDLHGYSAIPARDSTSVLREFLLALGVPAERMPGSPDAMGAHYRDLTSGRRLLIVLDNARGSEQIRPLLPGGEDCVTLVTSRDRLGGLVASDAARPVPLAELPPAHSTALLSAVLGPDLVAAEPEAAARLAELCDGLPLALRVAAARLVTRPHGGLAAFAGELADEHSRLDLLNVEDTGVAAALGLTVHHLPEPARDMFHRLGPHTGATLDTGTAAALADCPPGRATVALDQLAAAHLVVETGPRSYVLHDLVRLYARTLAPGHDPDALLRLLDHRLHTLLAACAAAEPGSEPCCTLPPGARHSVAVRTFTGRQDALVWYSAERDTLRGAVEAAAAAGMHDRAWRLVLLQWPLILWQVRDGWVPLLEQGLASAELDDDPGAQSRARALLGWVLSEEGRPEEALVQLEHAPALAARVGDTAGEATALINLAVELMRHGGRERPRDLLAQALSLAERAGLTETVTLAHLHLTHHFLAVGAPHEAADHAMRGLALAAPPLAAPRRVVLRTLYGKALAATGRTGEAVRQLDDAIREAHAADYAEGETEARLVLSVLANR
ncbi:AfsR/SARP family transcriptional regulator [Streptomyces netropsis]|uniref:DNA-binding SARP family transcriptional activator/Tfp pilus assembly protein PilF n=1 Tax=Streptomyces netropsis TaxID=55404 RepID=A0A7W7PDY7_STRNE|nr:BTAD domain-containing putative transcriptional regulator [Streptomyces netropsis]MBB4887301.1 DNA-binding SARP family transcriptional activator/Tfp pilus assembly protein PilF [Streptomyces netropsis]GGR09317.1 regulatory protein AfsR [Streptomyces netropsis]